ncbi:unnamed protein product [Acanthoscelides obtectus]|uniref:Ribonucleoside-diphosphate reductase n=1 Tax=Acanthoscelides obtectus TaxID=200917 RepID=A0A9P0JQH8_ACAOB|nr:unnamed protein product [Acanthoscelides obtectus]CAK1673785.1 Ribonucleoside-diphosphate reductase large subunit [Acanthoscelides obtectus]
MVNKPINRMYVLKRDGRKEEILLDKITSRIKKLCYGLDMDYVEPVSIMLKVVNAIHPGITTVELDTLAAETAASVNDHPDYATLAARIAISNLQKETKKQFSEVIDDLYNCYDRQSKKHNPIISKEHHDIIMQNADRLNSCIIYDRDFYFGYFGFKVLEQQFLKRINGKIVERPQHMLMRVAVGIHGEDIDSAIETYNLLSEHFYIHTSPTLHSAAMLKAQLISTFIVMMPDDSIDGIFECISRCGMISKYAGNIGLNIHNIRAKGTYIAGTNGVSNGVVPMLRVFNNMALYAKQYDTGRHASVAVYLEPWHADIFEFLNLGKPTGKDEIRARDLSYALWVPDLFMKRVESSGVWSLMCPHQSQGLADHYGDEFEELYERYESEGRFIKQIPAQELWKAIIVSQVETGGPYILYKDACNRKNNQKNLGTIRSANLSTETVLFSSPEEIPACSQASIAVPKFVNVAKRSFDFEKLMEVTRAVVRNLDKIIDVSYYAMPQEKSSNLKHRPIGIGIQGLADTFILLRMPFDSPEAAHLDRQIFETIYFAALTASCDLAEVHGPYESYKGSPASKGNLQFDMWEVTPTFNYDWKLLKERIAKHGLRNSLLVSQMPCKTGAEILGHNPSVEPYQTFISGKGDLQVINPHLLRDLTERDMWDDNIKSEILASRGSIQGIARVPDELKAIYRTVWEIPQKSILMMAADRAPFIDQSQSINIHIENPSYGILSSMHFYGWKKGLKTGLYHLTTKSGIKVAQPTVAKEKTAVKEEDLAEIKRKQDEEEEKNLASLVCSLKNPEACDMCGA